MSETNLRLIDIYNQNKKIIELLEGGAQPPQPPEPEFPSGGSIFGKTETRWVQITYARNFKIPLVKNGEIVYNESDSMRFTLPPIGQRRKTRVGDKIRVYKPHTQGDGTRLYEVYEYPGNFLMDRDILRI